MEDVKSRSLDRFTFAPDFSLADFSSRLPIAYTGADLYALCSDAMLEAMRDKVTQIQREFSSASFGPQQITFEQFLQSRTPAQLQPVVGLAHFQTALARLKPSVSPADLARYASLQQQFKH